jgi:hypothetical protein
MKEKQHLSESVVHRLYAHNVNDKDIWANRSMRQHVKYWLEHNFQHEVSCVAYIPIDTLVRMLERDLEKLKALKTLDTPSQSFKQEIGSEVFGAGDFFDEEPSIETLISYIEQLIAVLTKIKTPCGMENVEIL